MEMKGSAVEGLVEVFDGESAAIAHMNLYEVERSLRLGESGPAADTRVVWSPFQGLPKLSCCDSGRRSLRFRKCHGLACNEVSIAI